MTSRHGLLRRPKAGHRVTATGKLPPRALVVHFRVGLRALLHTAGIEVVADARTGEEAAAVAARFGPDVVLLGLDGSPIARAATWRLAEVAPGAKIIALTDTPEPNDVVDALAAGACGYLAKNNSIETIVAWIVRTAKWWKRRGQRHTRSARRRALRQSEPLPWPGDGRTLGGL